MDEDQIYSEINWVYEYWKYLDKHSKFVDEESFQKIREARTLLGYAWQNVHDNVEDANYRDKITKRLKKLKDDQLISVYEYMKNNGLI